MRTETAPGHSDVSLELSAVSRKVGVQVTARVVP